MIAFLFPGQGSQRPGMLATLERLPGARDVLDEAAATLGRDLRDDDTTQGYRSTIVAQRALLVAGVASARALHAAGVAVGAVAGHSVGAFAAAVTAGTLDFGDALRLVDARAHRMARAFPHGYGMGAITGLDERTVARLVREAPAADIFASNVNALDQIAIAGTSVAIDRLLRAASEAGARRTRVLDVGVPSHTPLMDAVARDLEAMMRPIAFAPARVVYARNVDGRLTQDGASIRDDLWSGVARPVRWADATRALYERGARFFVEMLPGSVLADLADAAFPHARAVAFESVDVTTVVALARRT
ncbi:MAG: malonate decarboxylase subunit epsilon [Vulcanimicrobiaceae bacterium]